ncbi:MAG: DUF2325 domain-containing protein [Burkholderiales bacterium]
MNAMVVGADRLGNIPDMLLQFGIRITQHVNGRNMAHQRKLPGLPRNTDLLILFTDFLGHNVMQNFRGLAREQGVPVVACRRSASCLAQSVERCLAHEKQKCAGCPLSR